MKRALRFVLLLVSMSLLVAPALAQRATAIDLGDTVEGELDDEHRTREYSFEGEAGQTVSITLLSDDYDPLVVLLDADGQEIAMNDDGGPVSLSSRIGPFSLPEDGEYTIVADSYSHYFNNDASEAVGSFTLILEAVNMRRIEYTQQVKDELTREQSTAYLQFRGQVGDVINVVVETEGFSADITLSRLDPEAMGTTLMNGSDNSGDGVTMIGGYMLPETGNYLIAVMSAAGDLGEFTLEVGKIEVTPLAFDETLELVFDEDNRLAYFSFDGELGDVISLIVEGDGEFDTTLALNGPDGYQLGYVDDANGLDPALINQILTQSGSYTVIIQPYQPGREGEVTLVLEHSELASLDEGPLTLAMSSLRTRETVTLSGQAGETVRLNVEVEGELTASPNVTITQAQQSVAYSSGSTVKRLSMDFTVPSDGPLYIQIDEYSYTDVNLLLTAERLGANETPLAEATEAVADEVTPTPTPAMPPTEEAAIETDEAEGLIEVTEEPIIEATAAATEPAAATEEPAPAETDAPDAEATEAG